jgi:type IX secretion system PorP/SprF family membrane protein
MKYILSAIFFGMFVLANIVANAQINSLGAQYYLNRYLANPALAGADEGLRLNVGYRTQGGNMPGAPKTGSLSTDYRINNVGLGLNIYKDEAGLLDATKFVGTYAYHLKLNDNASQLHFGLSVGVYDQRVNTASIVGSVNDQTVTQFNNNPTRLDGDFGFAYTSTHLSVEGALSNLRQQMGSQDESTLAYETFFTALSYTIDLDDAFLTPKVAYRGIKRNSNILDVGAELLALDKQIGLMALYRSNNSIGLGTSYEYKKQFRFMFLYTSSTSDVQNFTNNMFELGLQLNLHNLKRSK